MIQLTRSSNERTKKKWIYKYICFKAKERIENEINLALFFCIFLLRKESKKQKNILISYSSYIQTDLNYLRWIIKKKTNENE